jgi:hypothetical protein
MKPKSVKKHHQKQLENQLWLLIKSYAENVITSDQELQNTLAEIINKCSAYKFVLMGKDNIRVRKIAHLVRTNSFLDQLDALLLLTEDYQLDELNEVVWTLLQAVKDRPFDTNGNVAKLAHAFKKACLNL